MNCKNSIQQNICCSNAIIVECTDGKICMNCGTTEDKFDQEISALSANLSVEVEN